jgi:hypothetical protein
MQNQNPNRRWEDEYPGAPSIEAIRLLFVPPEHYRVSRSIYPPGTRFAGAMIEGLVFVIRGSCQFEFGASFQIAAGEFAELPEGEYQFASSGESETELVMVWRLPGE